MDDYSHLIPKADELKTVTESEPDYNKWLERTLRDIGNDLRQTKHTLASGGNLLYFYPVFRDGGRNYRMWQKHHQDVVKVLIERGYSVEVKDRILKSGGQSLILDISIPTPPPPDAG